MILQVAGYVAASLAAVPATTIAISTGLTLVERLVIGIAATFTLGNAFAYLLASVWGLRPATVIGGPLLVVLLGVAAAVLIRGTPRPWPRLRPASWSLDSLRREWRMALLLAAAAAISVPLYGHVLYETSDGLVAGYTNVWSDWSLHLSIANSFVHSANFPALDPLFSGTALRYPFLPDFQGAMLMALGVGAPAALVVPSAVLFVTAIAGIAALTVRLRSTIGAGAIAAGICILGGGLGFVGLFGDACHAHGSGAAQCEFSSAWHDPGVIAGTLAQLPAAATHQFRSYDGDFSTAGQLIFPDQQWYTPLFAWWLPQRTFLYGFVVALAVLLLLFAARKRPHGGAWPDFAIAGLLCGMLPLVQVQAAIVLAIVLAICFFMFLRWEWIGLVTTALCTGGWRVLQLAGGPHGAAQFSNTFPWLEPGWLAAPQGGPPPPNLFAALRGLVQPRLFVDFWLFWLHNGFLPVAGSVLLLVALILVPVPWPPARRLGDRLEKFAGRDVTRFAWPFLAVFVVFNVVVLQPWDWDNTKFLVYWYLALAMVLGAAAVRLRRWWGRVLAALGIITTVGTGVLGVIRVLPLTPAAYSAAGANLIASKEDQRLAQEVERRTPARAVFLTSGMPNDPVLTLTGRPALLGYYGWLWSYGENFGSRVDDAKAIYAGCSVQSGETTCASRLRGLLDRYGIDYVEVVTSPGVGAIATPNLGWWNSTRYPVVAQSRTTTVFDVRRERS